MSPPEAPRHRPWKDKFGDCLRGILWALQSQSSLRVHLLCTAVVIALASWFHVQRLEWGLLGLCIALVIAAELFNTALEQLAKAIDREQNPLIGSALDLASAAVLVTAIGAGTVGLLVFLPYVLEWIQ